MKKLLCLLFLFLIVNSCGGRGSDTSEEEDSPKKHAYLCEHVDKMFSCGNLNDFGKIGSCLQKESNRISSINDKIQQGAMTVADTTDEQNKKQNSIKDSLLSCVKPIRGYFLSSSQVEGMKKCLGDYHRDMSKLFHCN